VFPYRIANFGYLSLAASKEELSLSVARIEAIRLAKRILELDSSS
jgi:hypothetical protein